MGLFELSSQIRKIIGVIGLIILFLIFIWFLFIGLRAIYRGFNPPPQDTPIAFFGNLPLPQLPKNNPDLSITSFNLALPEGSLPATPSEITVYSIPRPSGTLSSLDEAILKADKFGLEETPNKLNETNYLWKDPKKPAKTLDMNIITNEYIYKYNPTIDPEILKGKFKITDEKAVKEAVKFLRRVDSLPEDLEGGKTNLKFYKQSGKKRSAVSSFSEANEVEILLYRKPIEGTYPLVQANPNTSLVRVILGTNSTIERGIVEVGYTYWKFDPNSSSLYPIRTSQQAWDDFQQGRASFVTGNQKSFSEISLANISLGYFEAKPYQPYLQPVFIFEGTGISKGKKVGFTAYLPAVTDTYIQ